MNARIPNFKITRKGAIILDFGLSEIQDTSLIEEELKDDCSTDTTDNISSAINTLQIS